jgi:hypothetical protein
MKIKPTNAYRRIRVSYIINVVNLLQVHVLATLVAIIREVSYKRHFTFCKISFVLHLLGDGHKSGRNVYMQECYYVYNMV